MQANYWWGQVYCGPPGPRCSAPRARARRISDVIQSTLDLWHLQRLRITCARICYHRRTSQCRRAGGGAAAPQNRAKPLFFGQKPAAKNEKYVVFVFIKPNNRNSFCRAR